MKRYGNLYEKICSMDNLYLAFQHAKKGKGWYKEVQQIQPYADRYYKDHIKKGGKKHERVRKSTQYKAA